MRSGKGGVGLAGSMDITPTRRRARGGVELRGRCHGAYVFEYTQNTEYYTRIQYILLSWMDPEDSFC
eukprot:COSAG02_NODE_1526_length_12092_cov_10.672392_4_plen_67_part_00